MTDRLIAPVIPPNRRVPCCTPARRSPPAFLSSSASRATPPKPSPGPSPTRAGRGEPWPAWKNLVFTGGPGAGKSRAAAAIAGLYRDLGVLRYGNLIEIPAIDLPGPTARDTAAQVTEAVKVTGDLVMITGRTPGTPCPTTASTSSAACIRS